MSDCHKVGRHPIGHVWFCSIHNKPWHECENAALRAEVERLKAVIAEDDTYESALRETEARCLRIAKEAQDFKAQLEAEREKVRGLEAYNSARNAFLEESELRAIGQGDSVNFNFALKAWRMAKARTIRPRPSPQATFKPDWECAEHKTFGSYNLPCAYCGEAGTRKPQATTVKECEDSRAYCSGCGAGPGIDCLSFCTKKPEPKKPGEV